MAADKETCRGEGDGRREGTLTSSAPEITAQPRTSDIHFHRLPPLRPRLPRPQTQFHRVPHSSSSCQRKIFPLTFARLRCLHVGGHAARFLNQGMRTGEGPNVRSVALSSEPSAAQPVRAHFRPGRRRLRRPRHLRFCETNPIRDP